MPIRCINLHIGLKRSETIEKTIRFFAEHKEGTTEELATYLNKDYTTALRIIKILLDTGYIRFSRFEKTEAKGKEKKYYILRLDGLAAYMAFKTINISEVAKAQSGMLKVFEKWEKFVKADLETVMIERLKEATQATLLTRFVFLPAVTGGIPMSEKDTHREKVFEQHILGFIYLTEPLDQVKEVLGKNWGSLQRVWAVAFKDHALRKLKDDLLYEHERECTESLKSLTEWRAFIERTEKEQAKVS